MDRLFFGNIPSQTLLFGRFRLLRCLSAGHLSGVYLCRDEAAPGRRMVLKVMSKRSGHEQAVLDRFYEEIKIARTIRNIHVLHCDEWMSDEEFVAFTMEYLEGGTLADLLEGRSMLEPREVIDILSQVTSGVSAIHATGIVHRDLKPENILMDLRGNVKICDFGIAANMGAPEGSEQDSIMGSMNYLSPEYIEHGLFDERSDIYSIGVIGYELATGRMPFEGRDLFDTLRLRVRFNPESPRVHRPDLPISLERIILKALQKSPHKRHQSAEELHQALASTADSLADQGGRSLISKITNIMALGIKSLGSPVAEGE